MHVNVVEEAVAARDQDETRSLLTPGGGAGYRRGMSSETGGGGFPGGFPSMPGFGDAGSADGETPDRLQELVERRRAGALSDADFEREKDRLLTGD